MSKEVIAVDIDEVLFPFVNEFLRDYNPRYGTNHSSQDFFTYEFHQILGVDFEETVRRVYEFNAQECAHISPIKDSIRAIDALSDKFSLTVVTARHPKHEEPAKRWLKSHYGDIFDDVIFVGHPEIMKEPRTKAEVCKEVGAIALVDDSLGHVSICAQNGIEGILFGDYPWNQSRDLPVGVTRHLDWPSVQEHFFNGKS